MPDKIIPVHPQATAEEIRDFHSMDMSPAEFAEKYNRHIDMTRLRDSFADNYAVGTLHTASNIAPVVAGAIISLPIWGIYCSATDHLPSHPVAVSGFMAMGLFIAVWGGVMAVKAIIGSKE